MKKALVILLTLILTVCLFAGCKHQPAPSIPDLAYSAEEMMDLVKEKASLNLSNYSFKVSDEGGFICSGIRSVDLVEEDAVMCEPDFGGGFSITMIKVKNAADAEKIRDEMNANLDTGKWICMFAEHLTVTVNGRYVMSVMTSEAECERISQAFADVYAEVTEAK